MRLWFIVKTLSIEIIGKAAQEQLNVAEKTKELQNLVDKVFPGFKIMIVLEEELPPGPEGKKKYDTALAAAKGVLNESDAPLEKQVILTRVNSYGFNISLPTLSGYLSKDETFVRDEDQRGVWGLKKHFQTQP